MVDADVNDVQEAATPQDYSVMIEGLPFYLSGEAPNKKKKKVRREWFLCDGFVAKKTAKKAWCLWGKDGQCRVQVWALTSVQLDGAPARKERTLLCDLHLQSKTKVDDSVVPLSDKQNNPKRSTTAWCR